MKSLNEKIVEAHYIANRLGTLINASAALDLSLDDETTGMIWGHADGLTAKWLYNRRDGRCSLQAMIDFDPEAEEARLDTQILTMRTLLEKEDD